MCFINLRKMNLEKRLDKIQVDFLKMYNEEYHEKLIPQEKEGDKSLWATANMFDLIPFKIERSRGNLIKSKVLTKRPKTDRIYEGVFSLDKLIRINLWKGVLLKGFSSYSEPEKNTIKQKKFLVKDGLNELVELNYFQIDKEKNVSKLISANRWGASVENYIYKDDLCSEIIIDNRVDMINKIIDLPNGITKKSITNIKYQLEYKDSILSGILDEKGRNILKSI